MGSCDHSFAFLDNLANWSHEYKFWDEEADTKPPDFQKFHPLLRERVQEGVWPKISLAISLANAISWYSKLHS